MSEFRATKFHIHKDLIKAILWLEVRTRGFTFFLQIIHNECDLGTIIAVPLLGEFCILPLFTISMDHINNTHFLLILFQKIYSLVSKAFYFIEKTSWSVKYKTKV